ncbi:hypothetical protein [Ruminococcus sp.]|uniref:hypothetical protein n=1 Tax=Ruminococcus sp. TaxID=41978 RepID=UPI0025F45184|nr:hypothetical protein [Ruminococcus sp.]MBQ8966690.1 hypothetical protein [Ruminococcus sp.]
MSEMIVHAFLFFDMDISGMVTAVQFCAWACFQRPVCNEGNDSCGADNFLHRPFISAQQQEGFLKVGAQLKIPCFDIVVINAQFYLQKLVKNSY